MKSKFDLYKNKIFIFENPYPKKEGDNPTWFLIRIFVVYKITIIHVACQRFFC